MASQDIYVVHTFPSHLQNQRQLFSRYAITSTGNTQCISELVNRFIPTAGSWRVLSLMKIINILKVIVCPSNELLPICYLILSKILKSSPDHHCIYMPLFCGRITPRFIETKETSLVLCILSCSIKPLPMQKLTNFEDWRTAVATALMYPFISIF